VIQLVPQTPAQLLALIESAERFEKLSGFGVADGLRDYFVSDDVSPDWVANLRASSAASPWVHGFAVVDPSARVVVGTVGFKGPPDDNGVVEIAYGIAPGFQNRGYATEAAAAGVEFAFGHGARCVRAHTRPGPNASTRVLEKCGFRCLGDAVDPDDGLVWRWERLCGADR